MTERGLRKLCLRLHECGLCLIVTSLRDTDCGVGMIDLLDGDVLLLKQRLDTMQVIGVEPELRCGSNSIGLGAADGCAGSVDIASSGLDAGLRRRDRGTGGQYSTVLRGNAAALVNDLLFERLLIG